MLYLGEWISKKISEWIFKQISKIKIQTNFRKDDQKYFCDNLSGKTFLKNKKKKMKDKIKKGPFAGLKRLHRYSRSLQPSAGARKKQPIGQQFF